MNFKGPNGISPCPICKIIATQNLEGATTYYVPHTLPHDQTSEQLSYWDPSSSPLHSDLEYLYFSTVLKLESIERWGSKADIGCLQ